MSASLPNAMPDVMLFAAGLGTRMRPLTDIRPKALIEVAGRPLIDHAIAAAADEAHTRFVVNTHHLAGQMAAHIGNVAARHPELAFALSPEPTLLDTGGGLTAALPLLSGDPILTLNTDTFWLAGADTPLARMRGLYAEGGAEIVLLCVAPDTALGFRRGPDFVLAEDGTLRQTGASGKPVIYAGAALVSRTLAASGPDAPFSLARHFFGAAARGTLKGAALAAPWFHVGDPEALAQCEDALAGREVRA